MLICNEGTLRFKLLRPTCSMVICDCHASFEPQMKTSSAISRKTMTHKLLKPDYCDIRMCLSSMTETLGLENDCYKLTAKHPVRIYKIYHKLISRPITYLKTIWFNSKVLISKQFQKKNVSRNKYMRQRSLTNFIKFVWCEF